MGNDAPDSPTAPDADPETVFAALAEIVYGGADTSEIYAAICVAATMIVPGCHHASVLVRQDSDRYITVAASDAIARHIDALERATGDGPCLDAIEDETAQIEPDLRTAGSWPQLAARVINETPVRGAMGFRLLIDEKKAGALDLFSDTAGGFDAAAAERAIMLAAFASVAINAAKRGEKVGQLRQGLMSNREIGKALGMLMLLHGIDHDEAFAILRRTSQDVNIKVAEVARAVVAQHAAEQGADASSSHTAD